MTRYIRETGLQAGDEVMMRRNAAGDYSISYRRANEQYDFRGKTGRIVLSLGAGWKVINI